jgi:hypothetical protein
MAQKSTYTEWHGEMICAGLAEGHSLLSICEALGVPYETARQWEVDIPEHGGNSARARELGCHYIAEQCLEIADDARNDWMQRHANKDDAPGWAINGEHVTRSRLRIDTRMRLIGKWLPKIYGEKVAVGGADDLPPIRSERPLADLTTEEIRAALAKLGG